MSVGRSLQLLIQRVWQAELRAVDVFHVTILTLKKRVRIVTVCHYLGVIMELARTQVRIPTELMAWLKEQAREQNRSMNAQLVEILAQTKRMAACASQK